MKAPDAATVLDGAIAAYADVPWEAEALKGELERIGEGVGLKLGKAQAPVRVAVTGRTVGPPLFESLVVLGRERTLERLGAARATPLRSPRPRRSSPTRRPVRAVGGQRGIAIALVAIFGFLALYIGVTFVQVWMASRHDGATKSDAIVVLGAAQYDGRPSPVLTARLDHALELWQEGLAPLIVVTGGKRPGDRFTEATAAANYLLDHGVPDAQILREVQGTSSWESLAAAARILRERGLDEVMLVSDPYHALRIGGIAEELGLTAHVSPTDDQPDLGNRVVPSHGQGDRRRRGRADHRLPPPPPARRADPAGPTAPRLASAEQVRLRSPEPFGGGVIGNTAGSGPVIGGSSPSPGARERPLVPSAAAYGTAPSSSGLGHHPLKVAARVRIPLGLPRSAESPVSERLGRAGRAAGSCPTPTSGSRRRT